MSAKGKTAEVLDAKIVNQVCNASWDALNLVKFGRMVRFSNAVRKLSSLLENCRALVHVMVKLKCRVLDELKICVYYNSL